MSKDRKVLVSNIMMLNERQRFDAVLRERGYEPIWANVSQSLDENECLFLVGDIAGWLAGDDAITRAVLAKAAPALKVISKWGTGIDSIDLAAAKELGIPVCNSPGAFSDAVAEVAIGYLLMLGRDLARIDRSIRLGQWPKPRSRELVGQTLGLVGFGAIGRGIARRAVGLGMRIFFYDPVVANHSQEISAKPLSLAKLAREADFVCVACNLTPENRHLIGKPFLDAMKSNAFIVNVARGPLIDESALIEALECRSIAGAALDVFEAEPLPPGSPLRKMEQVVFGSHNANNGLTAVETVHKNTLENLYRYLS